MDLRLKAFKRLLNIMDELRDQCPWDKSQTIQSLRYLSIEEMYELSDAIIDGNMDEIKKELGDLILHIVFYSKIASEDNHFDIIDVLNGICDKLIHRHPHIYSDVKVSTKEEVKENWEKLKLKEGKSSILEGVPRSLPSMVKAIRVQEKVQGVGFDWDNIEQAWGKFQEELDELKAEIMAGHKKNIEAEFGDVLFSLINYSRFLDVNPENALEKTNKKFIQRFQSMEKYINSDGKNFSEMTLNQMDYYWEKAKKK